jgi:hypothetical protein
VSEINIVKYTKEQDVIVRNGVNSISEILNGTNVEKKRSLLLCLNKYLDPYYGYNLPHFDEIILLLQKQLFSNEPKEVKEDILQLLRDYSKKSLDYLADKIEVLESEQDLLEEALYALGNTYNLKYVPVLIRYESHHNPTVRKVAKELLIDLSKTNTTYNE